VAIDLIDCPGIVPPNMNDTPEDILLRGVVRIENVEHPSHYIPALMSKVKKHHMERTYDLRGWEDYMTFLELLARKNGRLLKGGEPDVEGIAKMVVHDFLRGKIPWFTPCPTASDADTDGVVIEGREGKLGEMPKKRKRDDAQQDTPALSRDEEEDEEEDEEFGGFDSDDESVDGSAENPGLHVNSDDAGEEEESDDEEAEDRISLGASSDEEDEEDENAETVGAVEQADESSSDSGGAPITTNEDKGVRSNKRRRTRT